MAYVGTTTPLGAGATYTSPTKLRWRQDRISGSVRTDQAGDLFVEQSHDPAAGDANTAATAKWDVSVKTTVTANTTATFRENLVAPYWRVRFQNTAVSAQTELRLHATNESDGDS